jgi:hypothetical protein
MDPNKVLKQLRELVAQFRRGEFEDAPIAQESAHEELVDAADELDVWLSNGGFLPDDWAKIHEDNANILGKQAATLRYLFNLYDRVGLGPTSTTAAFLEARRLLSLVESLDKRLVSLGKVEVVGVEEDHKEDKGA